MGDEIRWALLLLAYFSGQEAGCTGRTVVATEDGTITALLAVLRFSFASSWMVL